MIKPKKSLAQNFLIDKNISRKILKLTKINNKKILEIGPGTGSLTEEIIKLKPKKLILIEKDNKIFKDLKSRYNKIKFITIMNKDILEFNFEKLKIDCIISNLPYNISSKVIQKILISNFSFNNVICMIQKEVADKINYKKKLKNNKLRFLVEATSNFDAKFEVPNNVFYPKPKVTSTVITLKQIIKHNINKNKLIIFSNKIFSKKRKKISNILIKENYKDSHSKYLLNMRAEDLLTKDLLYLFDKF